MWLNFVLEQGTIAISFTYYLILCRNTGLVFIEVELFLKILTTKSSETARMWCMRNHATDPTPLRIYQRYNVFRDCGNMPKFFIYHFEFK